MKMEPLHKKQTDALRDALGPSAMMINWDIVDFERGRENLGGDGRRFWLTDGTRIDVHFDDLTQTIAVSVFSD